MQKEIKEQNDREDEIDLLDLIGVLVRHKWLIIATTAAAAILILVFSVISLKLPADKSYLPNLYKPGSTVKINESSSGSGLSSLLNSSDLGALSGLVGMSGSGGSSNSALAIKLAEGRTLIDRLAEEFNLMEVYEIDSDFPVTDLRKIIRENLAIEEESETGTLNITYEDIDRELATKIVNRLVFFLEEQFSEIDKTSNYSQRDLLEKQIVDVEVQIRMYQERILQFQDDNNVLDATTMAEELTVKVVELHAAILEKEAEIATYQQRSLINDPAIQALTDQKHAMEVYLRSIENGTVENRLPPLKDMPGLVMKYEELQRMLAAQASIYKALLSQYEILKLQDKGTGPTFQVIEYAEIPEMKSGPSRGKLCVIVTMAAFFLSIFAAFIKEFWDNLKKDPARMEKLKGKKD
ncbi:MAG: hypothetical protein JEY99_10875 [Spirochaetales bacterium]|nr:hypothetical protein [Spirochaetales bacterium]